MRKWISGVAAALALALAGMSPAGAQEESAEDEVFGAMLSLFSPPALSAEEEARLPAAQAIVAKIVPAGTMGEMMNSMFSGLLGPIMELGAQPSSSAAAKKLGLEPFDLELDTEQSAEVLALLDPAWREREERTLAATQAAMGKMMTAMEPAMREAMAQLYAINFSASELADIDAFFSTPSGAAYARKSFTMASDPRMAGAMMQSMPEMMGSFAEMEADMAAAVADLPPVRTFADLDAAQRERLVELTGLDEAAIEEGMARAAAGGEDGGFEDYEDYDTYEEAADSDSY
jgi:hypothetical protein